MIGIELWIYNGLFLGLWSFQGMRIKSVATLTVQRWLMFRRWQHLFGIWNLFPDFRIHSFDKELEPAGIFQMVYQMLIITGKSIAMKMHITATLQAIGYCCTAYALCIFI